MNGNVCECVLCPGQTGCVSGACALQNHLAFHLCANGTESESGFIAKQVNTYKEFALVYLCKYTYKK